MQSPCVKSWERKTFKRRQVDLIIHAGIGTARSKQKKVPSAHVAKLVDLADYQDDSVVSRTIIDRKAGTITFFAFDKGQGLSEHEAPYDALIYLVDGTAEIVISGKATLVREGEMIVIPAKKPHSLKAVNKFKMILTMIHS